MYACYETPLPLQSKKAMLILPASRIETQAQVQESQSWGFNLPHMTNESLMGGVRRRILRRLLPITDGDVVPLESHEKSSKGRERNDQAACTYRSRLAK
jgi:hypothetical protein